jgi:hypothetical protein
MALLKLQLRPGVNREGTALSNEGTWYEMDKVRFRFGYPQKIGGWVLDEGQTTAALAPPAGAFWGTARSLFNWSTLAGNNLLGIGTHLKFYIQQSVNGNLYDVTPLRQTTAVAANAFTTTNGSAVVVCNVTSHGASDGDFVTISGVGGAINGIPAAALNTEFRLTYIDANSFSITASAPATSSGTTGAATFAMQLTIGLATYSALAGWGAGGWGGVTTGSSSTGWGDAAASGVGVQMRLWSQSNFGENLILNPRGGGIYLWQVGASLSTFDRAELLSSTSSGDYQTDADCPSTCNMVAVSDASRFVIAFGCNDYSASEMDPMLIRWSDQEDYTTWTPATDNQAGSYRLSLGSTIVAQQQTRQEILVLTDAAAYSMQYQGYPYFWGFNLLASNISVAGPNAMATATDTTYWMGVDKFYAYNGRVSTLPCPLSGYVFGDINMTQSYQFFAGTNEGFNEVWFFYCSADYTTVDRYVIFNYVENAWSYGSLARTAWLDSALREFPMAAGYSGQLIYHESGVDDGTTSPASAIEAYVQTGDMDLGDGDHVVFASRILPDINFNGSTVNAPSATLTVMPRRNPGAPYYPDETAQAVTSEQNYQTQRNYTVQEFTQIVHIRARGRVMALRIASDGLGVQWQLGNPRIELRQDGKR